jgi:guanylate kinase/deoxycytidine triphosphate deaminase
MEYQGIIITGTRGAGKSTVAKEFCQKYKSFQLVRAVTTREQRKDDANQYDYISQEELIDLDKKGNLLVKAEYGDKYYGITYNDYQQVINSGKIPLLVITPESAKILQTNTEQQCENERAFFTIFLDAPDNILNERINNRDGKINKLVEKQRLKDRESCETFLYKIDNIDLENTTNLIWTLWDSKKIGGILPKRWIELMISCGMLLQNAKINNVQGASYDLSIGDEHYYGGKIKTLSDKEPFICIEPYDYSIVTSNEIANLTRDTTGRFDLCVSLFCQGIILSNGPQVDPGFKGRLFCLLFNTSNAPVFLKRGQHYATIEFHKMIEPTLPYPGKYQHKDKIIHYLPSNTMRVAINELKKELERITQENKLLQEIFLGVISLILAIIAILLVIK